MAGVSGIGVLLMRMLGKYQYGLIMMILFVILATMLTIEFSVNRLGRKLEGGRKIDHRFCSPAAKVCV
jgi:ABC-type phosphate/phosphonate transport system permease subunit